MFNKAAGLAARFFSVLRKHFVKAGVQYQTNKTADDACKETENKNIKAAYSGLQHDLMLAKKIQKSILSDNFQAVKGLDINILYLPMEEIGGDIYDVHSLPSGICRIFLADAAGHGIQAALITMIIKAEYEKVKNSHTPALLLELLNNSFMSVYESVNIYYSCIVLDIDNDNGRIIYSSAGHPDGILLHGDETHFLSHTGKLIGVVKNASYYQRDHAFLSGDKIFLFTDGLFEQYDEYRNNYGEGRIIKIIGAGRRFRADEIVRLLIADISLYLGSPEKISLYDDISIISVEKE